MASLFEIAAILTGPLDLVGLTEPTIAQHIETHIENYSKILAALNEKHQTSLNITYLVGAM